MKLIKTVDAEGTVLCHDITQIIKGVTKDAVFRKGHVVTKEDIPVLLSVGKDQLYVWEKEEGMLHENEAAEVLCAMCRGDHMDRSQAKEGKIELTASCDGLLKVDNRGLKAVNGFGQMMIATRHGNFAVKKGDKLAGPDVQADNREAGSAGNGFAHQRGILVGGGDNGQFVTFQATAPERRGGRSSARRSAFRRPDSSP